jgi:phage protein D
VAASTIQSGLPNVDYYAPDFKVEVEGQELDASTKGDVLSVKVTLDLDDLDSFEVDINNWDDRKFDFKYSDKKTFDPGNVVHLKLGYADNLTLMVSGQITTLTPRFPESGPPTLHVAGLDKMVLLRDRKPQGSDKRQWLNMADWEIVQEIAKRNQLRFEPTKEGEKHPIVVQKNQDDAQFVMERARRIDFDCYIFTDPDSKESTLRFKKPSDARDSTKTRVYTFEWGKSLIQFNPVLTTSRQVSKVTVRGWDPAQKKAIIGTADQNDLPGTRTGESGPEVAKNRFGDKQEMVVDEPVTSQEEADKLARAHLLDRAYEYITGDGKVIGLPDLRPGDNVKLDGIGKRFSGEYYVKQVVHSLSASGFFTEFKVRRVFDGGTL